MRDFIAGPASYAKEHKVGCSCFSILAAMAFSAASRIHMVGTVADLTNYISEPNLSTFFLFLGSFAICLPLIAMLGFAVSRAILGPSDNARRPVVFSGLTNCIFILLCVVVLCVCWSPYYLACYPGGVFSDTFNAIRQVYWGGLNNQQPILYTLMVGAFIKASEATGHGLTVAIGAFCAVQFLLMAYVCAVILGRLRPACVPKVILLLSFLFFAFFPLIPAYAVSIWKDVPFTLALVMFCLALYDAARARGAGSRLLLVLGLRLLIYGLLVAFFRNNGKFIVALAFLALACLAFFRRGEGRAPFVATLGALAVCCMLAFIVQGPVYSRLGLNDTETTESIAIPMQQIAAISKSGGSMSADERAYVDTFLNAEDAKNYYNPCLFDLIKWYAPSYNGSVIEEDMGKFIHVWASLVARNPKVALDAYAMETCGFWAPNVASEDGYVSVSCWYNEFGLGNHDLLAGIGIHGASEAIQSIPPISAGIFAWVMLAAIAIALMERRWDAILGLLPLLALWLTVMVATPVAVSLRYVYALVLAVPMELEMLMAPSSRHGVSS